MARPSSPSVRFTALDAPTMTRTTNGIYNQPRFITAFLKNGTVTDVLNPSKYRNRAAHMAIINCPRNLYLGHRPWLSFFTTFMDDYIKVVKKDSQGLWPRYKFLGQFIIAMCAALFLYLEGFNTSVTVPFFKNAVINLGWLYIPFVVLVIVGASNAVNLTDGLDGLAIGPITIAAATYMLLAYLTGHTKIATYLQIMYVPKGGELTVFAGAMVGAGLGFLWFNTYPAQIFMGDVVCFALGSSLGMLASISKQEILHK